MRLWARQPGFKPPLGRLGKKIGKNRSVQEGLDKKIVAGLVRIGKNRSVKEGLDMKIVAGLDKIGLFIKRSV